MNLTLMFVSLFSHFYYYYYSSLTFTALASSLSSAGFEVYSIDSENSQIELSVCAAQDGQWQLSAVNDMKHKCGSSKSIKSESHLGNSQSDAEK